MASPRSRVTLVVTPRERFGLALLSLASIRTHTRAPYELVYVDAGSPEPVRQALAAEAQRHGYRLLRDDRILSPNQARNLGAREVETDYTVFIDNDVIVEPGWLERLVACADETGASVVGPIYCEGLPPATRIHMALGRAHLREGPPSRFIDEHVHYGEALAAVAPTVVRALVEQVEFHCMLVRREALAWLLPFDEEMLSLADHTDLCLRVRAAGGTVWFEPTSVVTYVPAGELGPDDVAFYERRWCEEWNLRSVRRFVEKWGLAADDPWIESVLVWGRRHRAAPRRMTCAGPGWVASEAKVGQLLHPAQTNLALYEQLRQRGVDVADRVRVRRAYELAMALFAGHHRSSGKPFLAHLVGTADILAQLGAPLPVVLAGLLHAAYSVDVWGRVSRRVTAAQRAEVRAALGDEAEALVWRYTTLPWTAETQRAILARPEDLVGRDREVVIMRLANDLEDLVDLATRYASKVVAGELEEELAGRLGHAHLAAAYAAARREAASVVLPPELQSDRTSSFAVVPRSHRSRVERVLQRAVVSLRDRLRR